ncbi:MAG: ATP-dependent DNA ligase, partial [bacterium]|nr:ATP-dependent DNA ligase [Candidatus Kapabacteria bacterium]
MRKDTPRLSWYDACSLSRKHPESIMSLKEYRRKRDFKITNEPAPTAKAKGKGKPIFVIQEHHATRLHYDFRLEADGALKSWAVTKEPTMDPKIRRLAIEVEDHPLEYATFHGDIPKGQYGAGHVEIWDSGTYNNVMATKDDPLTVAESIDAGHVEVELKGKKLEGKFVLVRIDERSGKPQWLLIKMKDEFAVEGAAAKPTAKTSAKPTSAKPTTKAAAKTTTKTTAKPAALPDEVRITSEDKVMFPDAGITKGEIVEYYRRVAPLMLPHLKDRPITIERYPDGLGEGKPSFWQKNTPAHYPAWIERVALESDDGKTINYTLVNNVETLLYLANQGAITFHVWTSRVDDLDRP